MRAEELKVLLEAQPFVPLRIYMTDGKTYDIYHPDSVLVLRSRIDIAVPAEDIRGILDRVEHCSLLHVVRIEELQDGKAAWNHARAIDSPCARSSSSNRLYFAKRSDCAIDPTLIWSPHATARSASQSSSVSPLRALTMTFQSAARASARAWSASVMVPI